MERDITTTFVSRDDTIHQAIGCIDRFGAGIALVVDPERRLVGTITDGDVRRVLLMGQNLDDPVQSLLILKDKTPYSRPVTARIGDDPASLLLAMQEHGIRQIPILDGEGRVVDIAVLDELLPDQVIGMEAVIMAGGFGTRLRPLTESVPKPMLPVGDRPLMELTIEQLRHSGIRRVNISTYYMSDKIMEYFGNGQDFNIDLNYVTEDQPLGTAGAIGLMPPPSEPLLVINGDILTRVDFKSMLAFHRENKAALTVAVRRYELNVPYGVIENDGSFIRKLVEKPCLKYFVNAGIYLLDPSVHQYIPQGQRFDMTDLIQRLIVVGEPVASFPIREYWLDIGRHGDYQQAQEDVRSRRFFS